VSLPVGAIPGVGKRAQETLERQQIFTVADLFSPRGTAVCKRFGRWGERILQIAAGVDTRAVCPAQVDERKSYSKDRTLEADTDDVSFLWAVTAELMERLTAKLRADRRGAGTITFKVRYADFTDVSHSESIGWRTDSNRDIFTCLYRLFRKTVRSRAKVRQVGVKLSGLGPPALQTDLFEPSRPRDWQRDRVSDEIRRRFGFQAVQPAWTSAHKLS
jgi:DNA polymerase IV